MEQSVSQVRGATQAGTDFRPCHALSDLHHSLKLRSRRVAQDVYPVLDGIVKNESENLAQVYTYHETSFGPNPGFGLVKSIHKS